jgi:hypothetical protein
VEESPYGEPIDSIQVLNIRNSAAAVSHGDYCTVEETGYKRVNDANHLQATQNDGQLEVAVRPINDKTNINPRTQVDNDTCASVLNSKSRKKKPQAEPVYAEVNKKKKKKVSVYIILRMFYVYVVVRV